VGDAFPSVKTLVRYTDLPERTVRTALGRLEAGGIIRPGDRAVAAAKIKQPDQRAAGLEPGHAPRDGGDREVIAVAPGLDGCGTGQPGLPAQAYGGATAAGRAVTPDGRLPFSA
jgi:hypothetical protein